MSPKNTRPPAVGVTPLISGNGALNCHFCAPVSASVAVIQPAQSLGSSWVPKPFVAPLHGVPAGDFARSSTDIRCTVVHQSTSPVKMRLLTGLYAGPFHSAPPCDPGQKRVPAVVIGASTFSTRVTALEYNCRPLARSITCRWPSFGASANSRRPALLVNKAGGVDASQS